ncbi:nuclear transport factor 2 family protein [uncultured Dubosiella sp.]|uniref:nuclear transport factor 2 family protein n=1 Tax=uncultured Dubosiella sp. TaxID=1937011 RepID=UPI00208CECFF|nr:nuclear transport factor 2 family protein [uncultured Dubosiella sp.]GJM57981.1 hypothetical protein EROP_16740 [Erysipelotrichaceae bacterium OPF54]
MKDAIQTSQQIWNAMHEENRKDLETYIMPDAWFVHMGITADRDEEIDIIEKRGIVYDTIDIEKQDVNTVGLVTFVYSKMKLTAIVNGQTVTNPFVVTEAYIEDEGKLRLASMSYTRINY